MIFACGLSNYSVAIFYLANHAFFKALLFLGAGSVIHAVGDEQDVRKISHTVLITGRLFIRYGVRSAVGRRGKLPDSNRFAKTPTRCFYFFSDHFCNNVLVDSRDFSDKKTQLAFT